MRGFLNMYKNGPGVKWNWPQLFTSYINNIPVKNMMLCPALNSISTDRAKISKLNFVFNSTDRAKTSKLNCVSTNELSKGCK